MITWALRVIGFIVMWLGLTLMVSILSTIADVVPFVGDIVGTATAAIMGLIALALSMVVIGFAWLYYRPLIGVAILVVAVAGFFIISRISGTDNRPVRASHRDRRGEMGHMCAVRY